MRWTRQCRARTESQGGLRPVSDQPARRRPALKRLRRNLARQHMSRSRGFGRGSRGRQRRVVLAPVAGVKLAEIFRARPGFRGIVNSSATEARGIRLREERAISRKTIAQGRPGVPAHLAVTRVHLVRTIAGAEGTRLSLRPLRFSRASPSHPFGRLAPRECEAVSSCRMGRAKRNPSLAVYRGSMGIASLHPSYEAVVPREGGASSTPRPQCAIAHKAGDDNRLAV